MKFTEEELDRFERINPGLLYKVMQTFPELKPLLDKSERFFKESPALLHILLEEADRLDMPKQVRNALKNAIKWRYEQVIKNPQHN